MRDLRLGITVGGVDDKDGIDTLAEAARAEVEVVKGALYLAASLNTGDHQIAEGGYVDC